MTSTAIKDAERLAESFGAMARHAVDAGGVKSLAALAGAGGRGFGPGADPFGTAERADENMRHVGGWVAAASRPIVQRIAGQPVRLARLKTTARRRKGHGPSPVKAAGGPRQPTTAAVVDADFRFRKEFLPDHLKALAPNLQIVVEHDFLDIIESPNSILTDWSLMAVTVASLEYTGEAYWFLGEGSGPDGRDEFWHLPTAWVKPVHTQSRAFAYYQVTPRNSGKTDNVPADNIVRFFYPDPADPLGSTCPLKHMAKAVSADEAIQTSQDRMFKNGIFPGLVLTVGSHQEVPGVKIRPRLTTAQRNEIVGLVKNLYRGVVRYDEPIILDQLIEKVHRISNSPREMDWLTSGKMTKARIFQSFGVNPIIAGEIENATRGTAAVADENFVFNTVNPKAALMSRVMTRWVRAMYGDPYLVAYIEPARPNDPEMTLKETELLTKSGAFTRDELRERYDYGPLPGSAGKTIILMPGQAIVPDSVSAHDGRATTTPAGVGGGGGGTGGTVGGGGPPGPDRRRGGDGVPPGGGAAAVRDPQEA